MNNKIICENGGCMCKLSGIDLKSLINAANIENGNLTTLSPEDCATYSLDKGSYLFSTDFGLIVGHDYFLGGKIAALNAISDVFAMGGTPIAALIMLGVTKKMTKDERIALLKGLYKICSDENISILGGHTIVSTEPMAGMSIIGIPNSPYIFYKRGALPGDNIWITKKLGTGIALRGYSNDLINEEGYKETIDEILVSNRLPEDISPYNSLIHAITDITGYGLVGHLSEMLDPYIGAEIFLNKIPTLNAIKHLSPYGLINDYIRNNIQYAGENCVLDNIEGDTIQELSMFDPQTNGGLIIIADSRVSFERQGYHCIGSITSKHTIKVISEEQ